MDDRSIVVLGILKPDGTIELDERPSLPAGRVEVTIRSLEKPVEAEGWWPYLQRVRAEREAAGYPFRTKEEIDAEMADLRDWDGKIDEFYRQIEEEGRRIEGANQPPRSE
jgi:hypothetical protein